MSNLLQGEGLMIANTMARCFDDPTFDEVSRGYRLGLALPTDDEIRVMVSDVTVHADENNRFCFSNPDAISEALLARDPFNHAPRWLRIDQDMEDPRTRTARYFRHTIMRSEAGFVDSLSCFRNRERTEQAFRYASELLGPASVIALANALDVMRLSVRASR